MDTPPITLSVIPTHSEPDDVKGNGSDMSSMMPDVVHGVYAAFDFLTFFMGLREHLHCF